MPIWNMFDYDKLYCAPGSCEHRDCKYALEQFNRPCFICNERIEVGEPYYIKKIEGVNGIATITEQVHCRCEYPSK